MEDYEAIMQEEPGGENFGYRATDGTEPETHSRFQPLNAADRQVRDMQYAGGWSVQQSYQAGGVAHRGIVHPDEFVDQNLLELMISRRLGFGHTIPDIQSVYRQGPLSPVQRQLRARIDARLLALSRAGGNMAVLATALKLNEKTIDRALARAREAEGA